MESMDPRYALEEFAQLAQQHSVDLDGKIDIDSTFDLRGCCAYVRLGTLLPEGIKVAVKTACGGPPEDVDSIKRSIQEVRQFSKLRHDNILPLLGITTKFDLTVSIVSPWMQRGNAHDYVQDKAIDPRPLIEGIARGLQYLHHHSEGAISHGNLKGRNVLISEDGQALLADFRISLYCNSLFSMSTSDYIGSALNWMAPEILDGCAASLEADVWAFGMMGLELFTRKDSFYGHRGTLGIVPRIAQGPPDRPGDEDTCFRMTNEWWNILASCWQSDPHSRPAVSDLLDTIVSLSRSKGNHLDTLSQLDPHTVVHRPDPRRMLEALVRQVSHNFPDINLDGRVDRNDNFVGRTISAATFLGTLRPSGAKVGVKIVCGDPPEDENTIKYLLDEVHVWSKFDHPNILPILGITTQFDLTVSIVSSWMKNGNAHQYVQDKATDPRPLIEGVARGLCYLHNQTSEGIIHGDVKGFNVLISNDGQALLADLSLSHLETTLFSMNIDRSINWTAPEILDGKGVASKMDVWSFAMTVLELFTRDLPFSGLSGVRDIMLRIFRGPPDRPSDESTCHRLTERWWDLCSACWNQEPSLRPTMSQIVHRITAIMNASDASQAITNNPDTISKPPGVLGIPDNLVPDAHPQSSLVVHTQDTVHTVTIFTTKEEPLPSSVELVLTLLPEDDPKWYGKYTPIIWRTLHFPVAQMEHKLTIPVVMGVSTIDVVDKSIYCDVRTTARTGRMFTFNQNKGWEQHVADDCSSDVIGIANNCGIPKAFAMYAATAEFGVEPLLCTLSHIPSGERVILGWPVILQARVCNQKADVGQFVPTASSGLFQGNGIDTRPLTQGNMSFQLYTKDDRYILQLVQT